MINESTIWVLTQRNWMSEATHPSYPIGWDRHRLHSLGLRTPGGHAENWVSLHAFGRPYVRSRAVETAAHKHMGSPRGRPAEAERLCGLSTRSNPLRK